MVTKLFCTLKIAAKSGLTFLNLILGFWASGLLGFWASGERELGLDRRETG